MNIARLTTVGATAALGLGLVLAPTVANAAVATPSASQAVTASPLPQPIDQTNYVQQLQIQDTVTAQGSADFIMTLKGAAPRATVNVTVNGVLSSAKADANGTARVEVTFLPKQNTVVVQSVKGDRVSPLDSYGYDFTPRG